MATTITIHAGTERCTLSRGLGDSETRREELSVGVGAISMATFFDDVAIFIGEVVLFRLGLHTNSA